MAAKKDHTYEKRVRDPVEVLSTPTAGNEDI